MIKFKCGNCKSQLIAPETLIGRTEVCPKCKHLNIIPHSRMMHFLHFDSQTRLTSRLLGAVVGLVVLIVIGYFVVIVVMDGFDQRLSNQVATLTAANDDLQANNAKLQKERQELCSGNTRLEKQCQQLQSTISNLQGQVQDLKQALAVAQVPASTPEPSQPVVLSIPTQQPVVPTPVAAVPAVPMPKEDQDKIRNTVNWLAKNKICPSCGGSGKIGASCCKDCEGRIYWMERIPQQVKVGEHLVEDGAAKRWVGDYVTVYSDVRREKGNGKTPLIKVRSALDSVLGLCLKYPGGVPADILQLARGTCCEIDPAMAGSFPP